MSKSHEVGVFSLYQAGHVTQRPKRPSNQVHTAMWARASLFRRFTDTNVYGTVPVKYGKFAPKMSVDIRIFFHYTGIENGVWHWCRLVGSKHAVQTTS